MTFRVVEAAVIALKAIHSCSILHGDIASRNILVVDDGRNISVRFIDFGFSRITSNEKELQEETAQLQNLLESLMASGILVFFIVL